MKSEELLYYAKLILLVVILGAVSYGIVMILQLDAVQAQAVVIIDVLTVAGYINSMRRAGKKEEERRASLKANGIQVVADFLDVELGWSHYFMVADHILRVVGTDPLTGEEKTYATTYYGPNEEPDRKEFPQKIMVYVDKSNPDNYYIDLSFLD